MGARAEPGGPRFVAPASGGRRVPTPPTVSCSVAAAAPWPKVRLGEICEIYDCPHTTAPDEGEGYPLVRTPNVGRGRLIFDKMHRVSREVYDRRNKRAVPKAGDIIFAREAPAGNTALITDGQQVCLGQRTVLIRPNNKITDSAYLAYCIISPKVQERLLGISHGSTVSHVNMPDIVNLEVPLPPLSTQCAIGKKLNQYDDLIENNKKRIAILERMAEHLYKEWFVRRRFPGHDAGVAENLTQRSRDAEEQRREIGRAASTMPPGWKVERLGNLADISTGKCNREDAEEDGVYPLFDRSQETKRSNEWIKDCEAIIVPGEGTSFMPRYYKGKFNLHQRCYCVAPQMEGIGKYLFYAIMLNRRYFLSVATGATVPSLRQNNFLSMKIIWPGKELAKRFDEVASRLFALKDNLQRQNALLSRQRDLLLPRLMSGKMAAAESLPTGQEVKS